VGGQLPRIIPNARIGSSAVTPPPAWSHVVSLVGRLPLAAISQVISIPSEDALSEAALVDWPARGIPRQRGRVTHRRGAAQDDRCVAAAAQHRRSEEGDHRSLHRPATSSRASSSTCATTAISFDQKMIRQRQSQQHLCSVCAGLSAQRERVCAHHQGAVCIQDGSGTAKIA
jgi:hypothetical protein